MINWGLGKRDRVIGGKGLGNQDLGMGIENLNLGTSGGDQPCTDGEDRGMRSIGDIQL